MTDPRRTVQVTVFDSSDGVRSHPLTNVFSLQVAKSVDGNLWFFSFDGVTVIDPHHHPHNQLSLPVHIEQITADRKTDDVSSKVRLPPLVRDLDIDCTALSLIAPEKIRFRYKLEGRDRDWQNVGNRRQAFYNDLPPRDYRFRVIASNNSGVWNEVGDSLAFSIAPAYYQTNWFRALMAAVVLAMLWGLYRLRLRQIAREFNVRLDERVNERTRIARELHDTLLQSFHGSLFRFQAVRNLLPRRLEEAMQALDGAISRAEEATAEGRGAIQDLRPEPSAHSDLEQLLSAMGQELEGSQRANNNSPNFSLTVEGKREALSPILQDEVYRISRELLRNAFQHAQARRIEAEIRYDFAQLRLRIRDDGTGIDPKILKEGNRAGHWGFSGMRERAKRIGARLDFWSGAGARTEAELTVPAYVAYAKPSNSSGSYSRAFRPFRRKTGTHAH